jgi:hypothetical protein
MATIYTRAIKGSALTWTEGDANITNLNTAKLENVVEDTTPQLGGNLDVNGNSIVSVSNGDITIAPNGTGDVHLVTDAVRVGDLNTEARISTYGTGNLVLTTNEGNDPDPTITIGNGANADITLTPSGTGKVIINGTLQVDGTTTTVNSTTVTVDDPIFTLGGDTAPASDDNKDRGIEFRWHNGAAAKVGFFGYDDSTGYLTFIPDATNTSEVFSGTQGDIQASNFRGALVGNADTATTLATSRAIYGNNFNGSAALTQVIASTYGGTGNGFAKFSGPTTSEKTFTLPDASSTIVVQGGALGTPSSGTLTNATGLPIGTGVSGLGANVATFLATPSSANLISAVTDETGSGALVFANTPTLVTPVLGAATGTSLTATGGGVLARAASTQDGIEIRGRAGGSGNWETILTPATLSADRTVTFPDDTFTVGYRNLPAVGSQSGSYSLTTANVGKYVEVASGGSITIPNSTFSAGDVVVIVNNHSAAITITCTITDAYIGGTDTDKATVSLATRGIANIFFVSGTRCIITGNVS